MSSSDAPRPFKCLEPDCRYAARRRHHLQYHVESVHGTERKYKCQSCDFTSKTKPHLAAHLRRDHAQIRYKCDICPAEFKIKTLLKWHQQGKHNNKFSLVCKECGYKTNNSNQYTAHLLTHSEERPCKCNKCGNNYKRKQDLKRHNCSHPDGPKGKKAFYCPMCTRAYDRPSLLEKHLLKVNCEANMSTTATDFPCPEEGCESTYASRQGLGKHRKNKHTAGEVATIAASAEENQFQCKQCPMSFKTKKEKKKHKKEAHKGNEEHELSLSPIKSAAEPAVPETPKKFVCKECSKEYASRNGLKNHMKVHAEPEENKTPMKTPQTPSNTPRKTPGQSQTPGKTVQCQQCHNSYANARGLARHVREKHREQEASEATPAKVKRDSSPVKTPAKTPAKTPVAKTPTAKTPAPKTPTKTPVAKTPAKAPAKADPSGETFACPLCANEFPKLRGAKEHCARQHKIPYAEACKSKSEVASIAPKTKAAAGVVPDTLQAELEKALSDHVCPLCEKTFTKQAGLTKHCRGIHKQSYGEICAEKGIVTKQPGKKKYSAIETKQPAKKKPSGAEFKCTSCLFLFPSKALMEWHVLKSHIKSLQPEEEAASSASHDCSKCTRMFDSADRLARHIRRKHIKAEDAAASVEVQCHFCERVFDTLDRMERHCERKHKGQTLPVLSKKHCTICGKKKKDMKDHMERRHAQEEEEKEDDDMQSSPCRICEQTFDSQQALMFHTAKIHNATPKPKQRTEAKTDNNDLLDCNFCTQKFKSASGRTNHINVKHSEQSVTVKCGMCKKNVKRTGYKRHWALAHPGETGEELKTEKVAEPVEVAEVKKVATEVKKVAKATEVRKRAAPVERVTCEICQKRVKKTGLKQHVNLAHGSDTAEEKEEGGTKKRKRKEGEEEEKSPKKKKTKKD